MSTTTTCLQIATLFDEVRALRASEAKPDGQQASYRWLAERCGVIRTGEKWTLFHKRRFEVLFNLVALIDSLDGNRELTRADLARAVNSQTGEPGTGIDFEVRLMIGSYVLARTHKEAAPAAA